MLTLFLLSLAWQATAQGATVERDHYSDACYNSDSDACPGRGLFK